jgi:hypothetical protein
MNANTWHVHPRNPNAKIYGQALTDTDLVLLGDKMSTEFGWADVHPNLCSTSTCRMTAEPLLRNGIVVIRPAKEVPNVPE